jgi:hypothetical protein
MNKFICNKHKGWKSKAQSIWYAKLKKAFNGLKQATILWYVKMDYFLCDLDFVCVRSMITLTLKLVNTDSLLLLCMLTIC